MNQFIPTVPEHYCFADENLLAETFTVDGFVRRNVERVQSLDTLKEQLGAYLRSLQQAMINLINEDYTGFVNLSANLVSFDKLIQNIKTPVLKLKNEIDDSQCKMNDVITAINDNHEKLKRIRHNKLKLSMIVEIIDYMDRVEKNLTLIESSSKSSNSTMMHPAAFNENAILCSRIQTNFDCVINCCDNTFISNIYHSYQLLMEKFYTTLDNELIDLMMMKSDDRLNKSSSSIEQMFMLYLIDGNNEKRLQQIIQQGIVELGFKQIIDSSDQVEIIVDRSIDLIENEWSTWIQVLANDEKFESFKYRLLVSSIWDPFVELFMIRSSTILLDLSDLDTFERNYFSIIKFYQQFIKQTSLSCNYSRYRLQKRNTFKRLMSKFKLNVYYHMKLKNLSTQMERSFQQFGFSFVFEDDDERERYRLNVTKMIHNQLMNCWPNHNNMGDLFVYCWKLTLKILSRFNKWLMNINFNYNNINNDNDDNNKKQQTLIALISDSNTLIDECSKFFSTVIEPLWFIYFNENVLHRLNKQQHINQNSLRTLFDEFRHNFQSTAIDKLMIMIRNEIVNECKLSLNQVDDIPRLYRRTNKDKPKEASNYVDKCIVQLIHFKQMLHSAHIDHQSLLIQILNDIAIHLKHSTLEVLNSVQKTEDSLKKLKKHKQQFTHNSQTNTLSNNNQQLSDDDKIRLQIYYDVTIFAQQLEEKLTVDIGALKSYKELLATIESLKLLK